MNKLLVVESQQIHRQALRETLSREGFDVDEAEDGQKAIAAVRNSGPYEIVLLADRLPGLSGNDTLIAIKNFKPKQSVIMLMGREDQRATTLAMGRGAAAIVKKPVKSEELVHSVKSIIEKARLQRKSEGHLKRLKLLEKHAAELTLMDTTEHLPEELIKEDRFLKKIIELTAEVLEANKVSLMLHDRERDQLYMAQSNWMTREVMNTIRQPTTRGVAGYVFREGKPVLIEDVNKDKRIKTATYTVQYESPSFICAPLFYNRKVVGTISVNDRRDMDPFSEGDLAILTTFSHLMSMGISNLAINRMVEREHLKITYINNLVFGLISSVSPDDLYGTLVDRMRTNLRATTCSLITVEEQGKKLMVQAASSMEELSQTRSLHDVGKGIMSKVLSLKKPYLANNLNNEPDLDRTVDLPGGTSPSRMLAVPLRQKDEVIGILSVFDKEDGQPFDKWDVEVMSALAPHLTMGLKNAWLYVNLIDNIEEIVRASRELDDVRQELARKTAELDRFMGKAAT
ncbi:MAG: GAF domain-containing protein [bacterium]|nr:MAG: GAF domain-containing protein [bacterium]